MTGGTADHAYYVHQGDNIALELDGLQSGDLTHRYLWGAAVDQLLADDPASGELLWALGDHEQTIRDVIDNSGNVELHRKYDSFGNITDTSGAADLLFAFTGRMLDKDTGLQNNLNRWYDPLVGRWLNEDPSGFTAGDMNLYRYVGNNPVNYVDPSGLDWSGFSSFMPGFQDYGSTTQWQTSGSVPRVNPPSNSVPLQLAPISLGRDELYGLGGWMMNTASADQWLGGAWAMTQDPLFSVDHDLGMNFFIDVAQEAGREMSAKSLAEFAGVSQLPRVMWPDNRANPPTRGPVNGPWPAETPGAKSPLEWHGQARYGLGRDGSARLISGDIDPSVLQQRLAGGEFVDPGAFRVKSTAGWAGYSTGNNDPTQLLWAALEVGASMVPYVGEAMDWQVLVSPSSAWWERGLAGASLGVNVLAAGLLPNAGGFLRGGRRLAGETAETVVDTVAGARRSVHNAPNRTTILGNDQTTRVVPFAERTGGRTLDNGLTESQWNALSPRQQWKVNDGQLRKHANEGDRFRDIGPDGRVRSLDLRKAELLRLRERGVPIERVSPGELRRILGE